MTEWRNMATLKKNSLRFIKGGGFLATIEGYS